MAQANAGAITKLLKKNGFERVEFSKGGRIAHAWGIGGFDTEQGRIRQGLVYLTWVFAGRYITLNAEQMAIAHASLAEMKSVLEKSGYSVDLWSERDSEGVLPYLLITKPE